MVERRQRKLIRELRGNIKFLKADIVKLISHLETVHKCDFLCRDLLTIDPFPTPFADAMPKVADSHIYHSWIQDKLRPVTRWDTFLDQLGWAWRKPYGWLLKFVTRLERWIER